jgi:23S rRNA (adenine2503-C2)-methyltransferase
MPASLNLKNLSLAELSARIEALGGTAPMARKLFARIFRDGIQDVAALRDTPHLSRTVREHVLAEGTLPQLEVLERRRAADGFVKYLFRSPLGGEIEAVRIPLFDTKYVVCLSSQVGCALACDFCATGKLGFQRNLQTWEILDQLLQIRAEADRRIDGVVFMGMGEPLLNLDACLRAAGMMMEPGGLQIDGRKITFSTAGVVPGIHRLIDAGVPHRLAFSVTSAIPEKRGTVMPIEKTHPLPTLLEAIQRYTEVRKQRAMVAYVLIRGFNTGREDAEALAAAFAGIPIKLDLIDVTDPSGKYLPPEPEELNAFRDYLQILKAPIARRYSGGAEIGAACGTLAATRSGGQLVELARP